MPNPTQAEKANIFKSLHIKGDPIVLYNIWDAGSAKAVSDAGAKAIATGSWSVAGAQGYDDGEALPLDMVLQIVSRIASTVDTPVTIDFEGGYAEDDEAITRNVSRLIDAGAIGLNFEDQRVGGEGLYDIDTQVSRIKAVRRAAEETGISAVINARTDICLKERDVTKHRLLLGQVEERGAAYFDAGADSYFVPGLVDADLIADICKTSRLPVNVMKKAGVPDNATLANLGVGRISYGPGPFVSAMATLAESFKNIE
jgi:2-methylisocitrate lyase-like PEP mutase family enzyme